MTATTTTRRQIVGAALAVATLGAGSAVAYPLAQTIAAQCPAKPVGRAPASPAGTGPDGRISQPSNPEAALQAADPVFAAIEQYREAHAAWVAALALEESWFDRAPGDAANAALWKYLRTVPTTMAGVLASLDYVNIMSADPEHDISDGLRDPEVDDEETDGSPRGVLLVTIAIALRSIAAVQS